jgi:hypothetical protein
MKNIINKYKSELSTLFGALVAIATAWQSIDWDNFEFSPGNISKLLLSAVIALGGFMTSINVKPNQ